MNRCPPCPTKLSHNPYSKIALLFKAISCLNALLSNSVNQDSSEPTIPGQFFLVFDHFVDALFQGAAPQIYAQHIFFWPMRKAGLDFRRQGSTNGQSGKRD